MKRGIALGLSQAKRDKTKIQQLKRKKKTTHKLTKQNTNKNGCWIYLCNQCLSPLTL